MALNWLEELRPGFDPGNALQQDEDRRRVDLVHVNVPENDHQGVTDGWEHYYWQPLREPPAAAKWKAEQRRKGKRKR